MNQKEKSRQSREKIIESAIQEFGTKGFRGATINAVCGHGIAKGLLYHYFSGKEELFLICAEKCFSSFIEYLRQRGGGENLKKCLELRARFFQDNPLYARIFFEALLQPPVGLGREIKEARREYEEFNRALYRQMISRLTLRKGVSEKMALEHFELMQDMFNCYFNSPAYAGHDMQALMEAHEEKLGTVLDLMLYGIAQKRIVVDGEAEDIDEKKEDK